MSNLVARFERLKPPKKMPISKLTFWIEVLQSDFDRFSWILFALVAGHEGFVSCAVMQTSMVSLPYIYSRQDVGVDEYDFDEREGAEAREKNENSVITERTHFTVHFQPS